MKSFDYIRAASVAEAVAAAKTPGSAYLAGGTNLLDLMKIGVARPDRIVDISRVPGLGAIDWLPNGDVRIGAFVRNSDLAYDERFLRTFPAVAEALLSGASAQLRNAATVGGNLVQRTRCAYFQDTASACNRRVPGSGCDALEGENRLHAVLGWSEHCIAVHPSDFCVPLVALDAVVEIEGSQGAREIDLESLYALPGDQPERETEMSQGELIVALRLPAEAAAVRLNARYLKLRERTSYAFAMVSAAAGLEIGRGDPPGAYSAWRRRGEALARPRRGGRPRRWPGLAGNLCTGGRYGARGGEALRRQRLQDRTGSPHHRARSATCIGRDTACDARSASLGVFHRADGRRSCRLSQRPPPRSAAMAPTLANR